MAGPVVEATCKVLLDYGPNTLRTQYLERNRGKGKDGKRLPPKWMDRLQASAGPHKSGNDPHIAGRALDIILFATEPNEKRIADELCQAFLRILDKIKLCALIYNGAEWNARGVKLPRNGDAIRRHVSHIHIEWAQANMNHAGFDEDLAAEVSNISDTPPSEI